jgi:hypothetical protein
MATKSSSKKKTSTRTKSSSARKSSAGRKSSSSKKSTATKKSSSKSASSKKSSRKYSPSSHKNVEREMHQYKKGTLKSGSGRKVKSRKQAIAIGLSEARREGKKVPSKKN